MCRMDAKADAAGACLLSLDVELLNLVLCKLSARETIQVSACCTQLLRSALEGSHAACRWRRHCEELLGGVIVDIVAAAQQAGDASVWHQLYTSSKHLDAVVWSAANPQQFSCSLHCSKGQRHASQHLARFGHTASVAGNLLVLLGGFSRDGTATDLDVSVLDVAGRRVIAPQLLGSKPPASRYLCTAVVTLEEGSLLHSKVTEAVQDQQQQQSDSCSIVSHGHTLVTFGGLTPDDAALGGQQLYILWLSADASWGVWLTVDTTGNAPAPRAYACCQPIRNSSQLIIYGGWANGSLEGTISTDVSIVDSFLLLCVYLLDVNSLTWTRKPTWPLDEPPKAGHVMAGPSTCPGPRKQAMCCCRVSPVTGHEEFVVLGGCGSDGLASCVPYALDLETFVWTKGPVMGYLPAARDAGALMQITSDWLLLIGGSGPQGDPLSDVQRLHLPSLSWRPPPTVYDSSSGSATAARRQPGRDTVDFTATAGVVVGGSREGPYGTMIVPRLELLLPGRPMAVGSSINRAAAQAEVPVGDDGFAGGFTRHHQQRQQQKMSAGYSWQHAAACLDGGCCCGSCCSCLARTAAATRQNDSSAGLGCMSRGCEAGTDDSWTPPAAGLLLQQQQDGPCTPPGHRDVSAGARYSMEQHSSPQQAHTTSTTKGFVGWMASTDAMASHTISKAVHDKQAAVGKQAHYGSWEKEIEPAEQQPLAPQQYIGTLANNQKSSAGTHPAAAAASTAAQQQQQWHATRKAGMQFKQLVAAVVVLLLGLLLVYPSLLLQDVAGSSRPPYGDGTA